MDNDETNVEETTETPEEKVEEIVSEEVVDDTSVDEDPNEDDDVDWKERALKAEKAIEKAKAKAKQTKTVSADTSLSPKDLLALNKANIEADDLDEVMQFAEYRKVSIADALSSPTLKAILAERNEHRASASASNKGATRRASAQLSDEALMANARKGIMPDNDADIRRLTELRFKDRR